MATLGARGNPHTSKVVTACRTGDIMVGKEGKEALLVFQLCIRAISILLGCATVRRPNTIFDVLAHASDCIPCKITLL